MAVVIVETAYGGALVEEVQREYVARYGGPDETPVDPAEFDPPTGIFLIAAADGEPVACGGFRTLEPGVGEIKRMYVTPRARGRGLARGILAELEDRARAAGCGVLKLETGANQPEAMALYASAGYEPCEPYGHYRCSPLSRPFAKML
jgi:GNAT superfamily N-acetyltransferase